MNKNILEDGSMLPIMEEFYSIQGEGYNTGKAAYFIRIGGCDIGCKWCDIKESWNPDLHPLVSVDNIISNIINAKSKAVVITGGEPFNYNLNYLCSQLKKNNVSTFLETSGVGSYSGQWDWICFSPKKNTKPEKKIFSLANELKIIIHDESDFEWAFFNSTLVNKKCLLFLQPEWKRKDKTLPLIIDFILKHPDWQLSLQTHKYIGIP